jgi:hypothetical protein
MTHPKNQTRATPAAPNQSRARPEDSTGEGHDQPMQKHLSAKPPVKSKSNTHLCITIRWWAAPPRYLPVAVGGAAVDRGAAGAVRWLRAADLAAVGVPARGGDVAC